MKFKNLFILLIIGVVVSLAGCESASYENVSLETATTVDSASYAYGYTIGSQMESQGMTTLNLELFMAGMHQAFERDSALVDQTRMAFLIRSYRVEARQRMMQQRMKKAQENKQQAQEFLAQHKEKEGIKVTESGLQYKVLKEGSGASPTAQDTVVVHYKGSLLSGKIFDSSYKRGKPLTIPANQVIKGWTEGLQLMQEGAVYKFWIPPKLAYGPTPRPGIPPNALLIFKVELIEVK